MTIKEENRLRIQKAYDLSKFGLFIKPPKKKVTEVFSEVATFLGYENGGAVSNIYYQCRRKDPHPLEEIKPKTNTSTSAHEN